MRRTKAQAAETKKQILESAEILFLQEGYEAVSLDKIAVSAGVTRGAIHWHFKNKQGLLSALHHEAQQPFQELASHILQDNSSDPFVLLEQLISDMFSEFATKPRTAGLIRAVMRLDILDAELDAENGGTFRRDIHEALKSIFQIIENKQGFPTPWNATSVASVFTATIVGLVGEWALGRADFALIPDGRNFIKMTLNTWRLPNINKC